MKTLYYRISLDLMLQKYNNIIDLGIGVVLVAVMNSIQCARSCMAAQVGS